MKISVCVGTYGEERWAQLAQLRAVPSTDGQGAFEIVTVHDAKGTVSSARNTAAAAALGDYLVFLDADDELAPGYIEAMRDAAEATHGDQMMLFTPKVSYVAHGTRQRPKFWPAVPFQDANWMVIGTMVSRSLFVEVGGFRDWGDPPGSNAYEDWAFWAECQKRGASVTMVEGAVYVAYQEETSRHRNQPHLTRLGWHHEIGRALFPDRYPERIEDWAPARQTLRRERRRG